MFADRSQYAVRVLKKPEDIKHADHIYCSSLNDCIWAIYDFVLKENLTDEVLKNIRDIPDVILASEKELSKSIAKLEDLIHEKEGKCGPAEGGKTPFDD